MSTVGRVLVTAGVLVIVVGALAQTPPTEQEKATDWKELAQLSQKFSWDFMSESTFTKDSEKYVSSWNEWKKEFIPFFEQFKKKYGATYEEVEPHFAGMEKPMGCKRDLFSSFTAAVNIDTAAHEQQMAKWAEKFAREQYNLWQHQADSGSSNVEVMMRRADRALRFMKLAKKLNEKGSYDDKIKACQEAVDKTLPEFKKQLKEKKWPGHNTSYSGPGTPDELAKAAIEFLKKHPDWTAPEFDDEHKPLVAAVAGSGWEVYKRAPLTEEPTQYSLKILVAFGGKKDAEIVYCYNMEFYTEERAGVKPGLPFRFCNSRQYDCYRLLHENLPK